MTRLSTGDESGDRVIVPAEREGPITGSTGETALVAAFGAAQVTRADFHIGEGDFVPGTVLFPESSEEVRIVWDGPIERTCPAWASIEGRRSSWKTNSGIRIETTVKEREELDTRPFVFAGFGFDAGGTVRRLNPEVIVMEHHWGRRTREEVVTGAIRPCGHRRVFPRLNPGGTHDPQTNRLRPVANEQDADTCLPIGSPELVSGSAPRSGPRSGSERDPEREGVR